MRFRATITTIHNRAPRHLGAFLFAALLSGLPGCRKSGTPDWDSGKTSPFAEAPAPVAEAPPKPEPKEKKPNAPSGEGVRFITYNVRNWLTMDRRKDGKVIKEIPKPEAEKQAVIELLVRHQPDIIGICEVGEAADLAEIRERLKSKGLDLPHSHYTGGSDPERHLGLLSRFPITSTAKPAETSFRVEGQTFAINRGILDATIEARGKSYRFLGLHLKSKRDSEYGDQEAIRLHEAQLLRRHVDSILKADPGARLVVYGDMNDTRSSPVIRSVLGKYGDPASLAAIPAKDSRNTAWTHHWALHDIYSRVDYVMVSRPVRKDVDEASCRVIDDEGWEKASDHRPVLAVFR
jgi:endonuclease/exonuclease/phosphatase family metal-dependent hydrolase